MESDAPDCSRQRAAHEHQDIAFSVAGFGEGDFVESAKLALVKGWGALLIVYVISVI